MNYKISIHAIVSLFIILFIIKSDNILGQEYKAVALSGSCEIQKNNNTWTKLQTGQKIKASDKIKINKDAYAGLIDDNGKTIELKVPGIYGKTELDRLSLGKKNVLQKFAGYLISESVVQKKSDNMKTLGAVVRGRGDQIDLFFPLRTMLMEKEINIKWYSLLKDQNYLLKILNEDGTFLSIYETRDTSFIVNLKTFGMIKGRNYKFIVSNARREEISSDTVVISICDNALKNEYNTLISEISKETLNPIDRLILVTWLSSKELNYETLNEYERLIEMNSLIDDINQSYAEFLIKQGITRKAEILTNKGKGI